MLRVRCIPGSAAQVGWWIINVPQRLVHDLGTVLQDHCEALHDRCMIFMSVDSIPLYSVACHDIAPPLHGVSCYGHNGRRVINIMLEGKRRVPEATDVEWRILWHECCRAWHDRCIVMHRMLRLLQGIADWCIMLLHAAQHCMARA